MFGARLRSEVKNLSILCFLFTGFIVFLHGMEGSSETATAESAVNEEVVSPVTAVPQEVSVAPSASAAVVQPAASQQVTPQVATTQPKKTVTTTPAASRYIAPGSLSKKTDTTTSEESLKKREAALKKIRETKVQKAPLATPRVKETRSIDPRDKFKKKPISTGTPHVVAPKIIRIAPATTTPAAATQKPAITRPGGSSETPQDPAVDSSANSAVTETTGSSDPGTSTN